LKLRCPALLGYLSRQHLKEPAMSSGWAVHLTYPDGASEVLYVRIADRGEAVTSLRSRFGSAKMIEARSPIQSSVFDALNVAEGEWRPWHPAGT
jgi:hypothetical protein